MKKPPEKKCPECGHEFKNFKWRLHRDYDGTLASCPKCGTIALEKGYKAWLKLNL